ncbi:MAG: GDSL-type esterase/lipase family protein [Puniceicoccales bacterium]|jgi:beta-glucosidase|nr:GDSL-type esterase/lipase family protein [Puniceicoccales bacterium]
MKIPRRRFIYFLGTLLGLGIATAVFVWRRMAPGIGRPRTKVFWWMPRHEELVRRIRENSYDVVFFGDSITHKWEDAGREVWEKEFAPLDVRVKALNAGFGGDHTTHLLWHLQNGFLDGKSGTKLFVVLIGTNDIPYFSPVIENIRIIVDEIQRHRPSARILLLGILPRGEFPDDFRRKINSRVNAAISGFADGKRIFYKDTGSVFLLSDGRINKEFMADFIHLTKSGYRVWADVLFPEVRRLL